MDGPVEPLLDAWRVCERCNRCGYNHPRNSARTGILLATVAYALIGLVWALTLNVGVGRRVADLLTDAAGIQLALLWPLQMAQRLGLLGMWSGWRGRHRDGGHLCDGHCHGWRPWDDTYPMVSPNRLRVSANVSGQMGACSGMVLRVPGSIRSPMPFPFTPSSKAVAHATPIRK